MRLAFFPVFLISLAALAQTPAQAPAAKPEGAAAATPAGPDISRLRFRLLGPAVASGRVVAFAVHPQNKASYFIAVASGGVWKTTNNGTSFTPVFDGEGSYSIGTVVLDPRNPNTVWVGTGEGNSQRSVGYGDGVYRSDDGGRSWKNLGLKTSEHIGKIVIDPRDSNTVYVAAQGPLWGPGGDRGLYKTTDGGKTWKQILKISDDTGVTDIVLDPNNPDILLTAAWQRRRHFYTLVNGGPESALYKSTDGGATFRKITSGLPAVQLGRISLAASPAQANLVYARVEGQSKTGGIYRSTDFGDSWTKQNSFEGLPMYYGQIAADPKNPDRIVLGDTIMRISDDGGKTIRALGDKNKHVDSHTIWFDPDNTEHILVGCDGGIYESYDRGQLWQFKANLPTVQFYDIAVDTSKPFYYVYGGTQDNATWGGPSRTTSSAGILNADWFVTTYGDGFQTRVDPVDPNIVYSESQNGGLVRFDRRNGERISIAPTEAKGESALRWNWDSPLLISPHAATRLYYGANRLYRSDDRGNSWKPVSADLTRQADRDRLPVFGKIQSIDAVARHQSTAFYSNLSALAESPLKEGVLFTGADDGLVQISENGGAAWRKVESLPGVPQGAYIRRILPSQHDARTVYVAVDNHQNSDFKPYVLKSTDLGATWAPIQANLPERGTVYALAEDPVNASLLFAGTEFGLFYSPDGGKAWTRFKGGLPTIAVRDIAIQKQHNDLVIGTFGRGIYVLDDYSPLRELNKEVTDREATLFKPRNAHLFVERTPFGLRGKGDQGEAFYAADNPAYGVSFSYFLKDAYKSAKEKRQDAQKEAEKDKKEPPLPTPEDLTREADEEPPAVIVTVADAQGNVVRRLTGPVTKGLNRVNWDLRYPNAVLPPPQSEDNVFGPRAVGPFAPPGRYTVSIAKRIAGVTTTVAQAQTFEVTADGSPAKEYFDFHKRAMATRRALDAASELSNTTRAHITAAKRAIQESTADAKLRDQASALEGRLIQIQRALRGNEVLAERNNNAPPSISERLNYAVFGTSQTLQAPTRTQEDNHRIAAEDLAVEYGKLRTLVETDLKRLEKAMDAAGVPHTPGRIPEFK